MSTLSVREQSFVAEYLRNGGNATQAAKAAGYSARTAYSQGGRLLKRVEVRRALEAAKGRVAKRAELSREKVLRELAAIGFSRMDEFTAWGPDGVQFKPSGELSKRARRAVAEVVEVRGEKGGSLRFKLHDKVQALQLLGRELGMFAERHIVALEKDRRALIAALRAEAPEEVVQRVLQRLARGEQAAPMLPAGPAGEGK